MDNALGMKGGNPIIGSTWKLNKIDVLLYTITGPPIKGTVPLTRNGEEGLHHGLLANFQAGKHWTLVALPATSEKVIAPQAGKDEELRWLPLKRGLLELEELARGFEADGHLADAKMYSKRAVQARATDALIVAEESALAAHRYVSKAYLKSLSPGDRSCYEIKGLKSFQVHTEAAEYLYWNE